jgi:HAD superfamily hydrolase (TIGR01490 family)
MSSAEAVTSVGARGAGTGDARNRIAAFFDLDGTLLPLPSLEHHFIRALHNHRAIPVSNYFRWFAEAVRHAPDGLQFVKNANKMYLRNFQAIAGLSTSTDGPVYVPHRLVDPELRSAAAARDHTTSSPTATLDLLPPFFPSAIHRMAWHATQAHRIILITGTLDFLAKQAALALTLRLLASGITTKIGVRATQLQQREGRWTGHIDGEPMFGEGKARAIREIAKAHAFSLANSYAYADSANDRWMLAAVGHPTAVNPSRELERVARLRSWPFVWWRESQPGARQAQGPFASKAKPQPHVNAKAFTNIKSESTG